MLHSKMNVRNTGFLNAIDTKRSLGREERDGER